MLCDTSTGEAETGGSLGFDAWAVFLVNSSQWETLPQKTEWMTLEER